MPSSPLLLAKRAFVHLLLTMAKAHNIDISVNRDSPDNVIMKAYRRVVLKAHPDKGGNTKKFQKLQAAREQWESARKDGAPVGRPHSGAEGRLVQSKQKSAQKQGMRVRGVMVLLTYFGTWSVALWKSFLAFVRGKLALWSILRWCCTLEQSGEGNLHVHLALQFRQPVDRDSKHFAWKGRFPNASSNDYLGTGLNKNPRYLQQSVDRGFFYVYADKDGTQRDSRGEVCVAGNHFPCWEKIYFCQE